MTISLTHKKDHGRVQLSSLQIGKRHRDLHHSRKVAALAKSMAAIGLQQPISVRADEHDVMHLVAGLHRVEAARRLGWEYIDCIFIDLSELDSELWEIDENLMRVELSTDEKRAHLRRRKELWEKRAKSVVAHDAPKLVSKRGRVGEGRPRSFAADTAAATGLSKSQINRLIAEPKLEVEGEVLDQPHPLDPPGFLDRRKGGRGEKDEAEAAAVASAEKGGVSKTTVRPKPKPEPKRYTARPLPKPRSGKPILGLEAARRHYLDQCAGADVDLEQERDIILDALRELADKRAIAGKPKCTEGEREQSELFKQVKRGGLYRTPPADCFPPTPTPQNESEKENG